MEDIFKDKCLTLLEAVYFSLNYLISSYKQLRINFISQRSTERYTEFHREKSFIVELRVFFVKLRVTAYLLTLITDSISVEAAIV